MKHYSSSGGHSQARRPEIAMIPQQVAFAKWYHVYWTGIQAKQTIADTKFCLFQELYRKKNEGKRRQRQLHKYEQNLLRPKLVASDAFKAVNGYVETNISIIVRGDEQAPIGSGPRNCHKGNAHRAWKNPTAGGNRL